MLEKVHIRKDSDFELDAHNVQAEKQRIASSSMISHFSIKLNPNFYSLLELVKALAFLYFYQFTPAEARQHIYSGLNVAWNSQRALLFSKTTQTPSHSKMGSLESCSSY